MLARFGVVTVSDRASDGTYTDRSGPAVEAYLEDALCSPLVCHRRLVPDERPIIEAVLKDLVDEVGCDMVVTTGGTGPAKRDVTPEATAAVCDRIIPGFGEEMRRVSIQEIRTALLSRQIAGIRGSSLIVNLPGSPRAIKTCLDAVFPAVPDCLDQLGATNIEVVDRLKAHRHRPVTKQG